jgi:plastocyanin
MTIRARNRTLAGGLIFGVIVAIATLLPMVASSGSDDIREVRIVARDMSFYLEGKPEPNPTLTFKAGERVKLVLRNEDAGMSHDLVVRGWTIGTRLLDDRGEEDSVTFQVPSERGSTTYHCTPHAKMMSGTLRIE